VPRKTSQTLTEAELRIMQVLWQKGAGTVQQILDVLPGNPALAYNTVLTTIRILERKGYVGHAKDGRAHIYNPLVAEEEASRSEIRHLVSRFFRNSHEDLVLNILEDRGIAPEELKRLRKMLEAMDNDQTPSPKAAGTTEEPLPQSLSGSDAR
jgi:BlaI family transcriptional regulator, penicillinase repressor